MSFNLLRAPWIPVLFADGRVERLGLIATLTQSASIRQLATASPLDQVAVLRFLIALLQWAKPVLSVEELASLDSADGVPEAWLRPVLEHERRFNLLGEAPRFYQDPAQAANVKRPVGDLLHEFPTATKVAHFRHVRDREYGLCPACCALGIIRHCSYAFYAGSGYTSGVNGPAPAYAVPLGTSLLRTLELNWPLPGSLSGIAPWLTDVRPKTLDAVTVLAWRSRSVWLGDCGEPEICAYCGNKTRLVRQIANTGGWERDEAVEGAKSFWKDDPHLLVVNVKKKLASQLDTSERDELNRGTAAGLREAAQLSTLGFNNPQEPTRSHVRVWRRVLEVLARSPKARNPQVARILFAGPATTKNGQLYLDSACIEISKALLAGVLGEPASLPIAEFMIHSFANVLRRAAEDLPGRRRSKIAGRSHQDRLAAAEVLLPGAEAELKNELSRAGEGSPSGPVVEQVLAERLAGPLRDILDTVIAASTRGSALNHQVSRIRTRREFASSLQKGFGSVPSPSAGSHLKSRERRGGDSK